MMLQPRARFISDCCYGATGTGKTFQMALAAQRMWDRFKLRTRYIGGDSGGFDTLGNLVEDGIVIPFVIANHPHPIEVMDQLTSGMWPNEKGELVRGPADDIGLYVYEGLTSIGDLMMRHLSRNKTRLSQDPAYTYLDGKTEFSGTNMSYFGEVQNRLYDQVVKSSVLNTVIPSLQRVGWTALEGRGEEDGTKAPTFGPSIVGKKSTGKAGQWFGNLLHLEMLVTEVADPATKQINLQQKRVMYLAPHADPVTKLPFPAKVRVPFNRVAEAPKSPMDPPDLGKLYDILDNFRSSGQR